ncbi:vacuolar protein sorting-associated protein 64 [Chaetomidium leptoderma]|uniref:Vacuolar protein sorting-associated protein 64 n=1 Tax=Chaetomidium leptoderma TaxID=669021 RepID=A0AAN6VS11_9PEZI|nr:vacuolar protein sorting-associated protein 64 [Chaetomidium leptoderma]
MTAVANPPSFANLNRPGWINGGQPLNSMNSSDDVRGINMFMQRKTLQRTNSSSSVSSSASNSSTSTVTSNPTSQTNGGPMAAAAETNGWSNPASRKRTAAKGPWPNGKPEAPDFPRAPSGRAPMTNGINGASALHQQQSMLAPQNQLVGQSGPGRPGTEAMGSGRQPVLYLLSLNGSFERKTISVPYFPDTLRIGRQTNAKTVPTPVNGYFDSKVLSRQHAEIWADTNGKIWIRDVKSSNGTFVNGTRLSPENRESEPHELQTQDHLELGIDIVSEDQKSVVHHKVAAKVEHAGFITPTSNVLDMNFGDLDPSNGAMMLPVGGISPFRGRPGSQPGAAANNRMAPANMGGQANTLAQQRQFWLNPITTEHIVKKLHTEMRNARLQNQDLARTSQFISALLSKEDIRNTDKPEVPEPPKSHLPNGNISFRSDGGKTRFSEPPAPPPSQPLPEKPDAARASDAPSLKRAATERQKPASTSPIRQDNNLNQILLLTEALNNAKKELDSHTVRVRNLEEMLTKEREARLYAEDMVQKMEETSHAKMNGSADPPLVNGHSELDKAFDPPVEQAANPEDEMDLDSPEDEEATLTQPDKAELLAAAFQARIDSMALEMNGMREQLEAFRLRAEKAEAERDADRKTLAEMVLQIRQRDEEEKKREAERRSRSLSKARRRAPSQDKALEETVPSMNGSAKEPSTAQIDEPAEEENTDVAPTRSRANTLKPSGGALAVQGQPQESALIHTLPYASMFGVVLFGMGLMAYLNGWQPQQRLDR